MGKVEHLDRIKTRLLLARSKGVAEEVGGSLLDLHRATENLVGLVDATDAEFTAGIDQLIAAVDQVLADKKED